MVDCALPHTSEVFALVTPAADAYPGGDALRRTARLECPRRFADYVGARYELSTYGLGSELPTAEQWTASPTIGCTVTGPGDGRTAGSARGSGR